MNLKNFLKKRLKKDNTRYLVKTSTDNFSYTTYYSNITNLIKYLKKNENKIEKINIKLLSN